MKYPIFSVIMFFQSIVLMQGQVHVNRLWETHSGNPIALQWTNSITNSSLEIISIGNTSVVGQGANMLVTKMDGSGNIVWQTDFNSSGTANDYGVALVEDASGNVYTVGTTDNNTTTDYDVLVAKYNSSGSLSWATSYTSPYSLNDVGTAIKVDGYGNVYVCASSESSTNNYDFLTIKLNSAGSLLWTQRYDYTSLVEIPIGIDIDISGNIVVTGSSASSATKWAYAVVRYTSSGTYIDATRSALPGIGQDQPLAFKKDMSGNFYITGRGSSDGINYDIKTIKLDASYNILWTKVYDLDGKEDLACTIDVDASGNVYVGGFVTQSNNVKKMIIIKYDASGNFVWDLTQAGADPSNDAAVKSLEVKSSTEIYFLAVETRLNGTTDCVLSKVDGTGGLIWERKLNHLYPVTPASLKVAADNSIYITVVSNSVMNEYETIKYSEFSQDSIVVSNTTGGPSYKANELIVRFLPSALNATLIDDKRIEYGKIQDFLVPTALNKFNKTLEEQCSGSDPDNPCTVTAVKIFKRLQSTDTQTLSRLGETIPIPDFWATLLLVFPDGMDISDITQALGNIEDVVIYAEPNYLISLTAISDPEYPIQHSLHNTGPYPNAHINVEEAWNIVPSGGSPTVRCGVFDTGIDWRHEDFGYDGSDPNSSKVVDGWDFRFDVPIKSSQNIEGQHGTPVAGIIGAIRDNDIGVAGIAGGSENGSPGITDEGVSLYSLKIFGLTFFENTISYVGNAITTSAIDNPNLDYGYGLHLSSNSWGLVEGSTFAGVTNIGILKEAVHFANRAKVTFVAARGNNGVNNVVYPAIIDDDWVLSVGGSGLNGGYKDSIGNGDNGFTPVWAPSYGNNMDVVAPCISELVRTTQDIVGYRNFNGTSAAAPHVSGVVALMMSYWNTPAPSYQNLAPEDCEHIIELSATDVGPAGYDSRTGWGRLNAGNAIKLIEKPFNAVNHYGTNFLSPYSKTKTLVSTGDTVRFKERFRNEAGTWVIEQFVPYIVNAWRINATVNHTLGPNDNIVAYWPRNSSSTVFEPIINDSILPHERITINSLNSTTCNMTGYVYQVFNTSGTLLGWWPFDTTLSKAQFEYTILTHASFPTSVDEFQDKNWVELFPNPATNSQTLLIQGDTDEQELRVELYNMQGRLLRNVYKGNIQPVAIDISELSSSVYFYRIFLGDKNRTLRFVKQ